MSHRQVPGHHRIAVIGAGFGGIGMGAKLLEAGEQDFVIFDKADGIGGTWWVNRYPGCACDVPAHLYSFSFAPNPDWSRWFAPRAEIQAYLEDCVERFGLRSHLRLNTEIRRFRWDTATRCWHLEDDRGGHWTARVVVSATGALSRPNWPGIPGLENFGGVLFHSQQWNGVHDLTGRRVAVIGTGTTSAQIVPEIAPKVKKLDVYQRTPNWILPRPDAATGPRQRRLYRRFPALQKLPRFGIWLSSEMRVPAFIWSRRLGALHKLLARRQLARQVPDPHLREKLLPDFELGCKRIILSSDFYPALMRDNVELVTESIERVESDAIVDAGGRRRPADTLVLATGFKATKPVPEGLVRGRGGRDLAAAWRGGPQAYRGVAVAGFPNLFLLLGPNTGLGHNSVVLMIEAQIGYVIEALRHMRRAGLDSLEVRGRAQRDYNRKLHRRLASTVWNTGGCRSWYLHPETGRNSTLWPGFTWQYARLMGRFDSAVFR